MFPVKRTLWPPLAKLYELFPSTELLCGHKNAILMFHSIGQGYGDPEGRVLTEETFENTIQYVEEHFDVVDLPAVIGEQADQGSRKKVAITFDDAYRDFYTTALPVLREYQVPATLFVISDCIGETGPTDVTSAPGQPSFMTKSQIRTVSEGELVAIGNHTKTHRDLTMTTQRAALEREIIGGKRTLESLLDTSVERFCYPGGKFDGRCSEIVRSSHQFAVTTRRGLVEPDGDRYLLPRIDGNQHEHVMHWELADVSDRIWKL